MFFGVKHVGAVGVFYHKNQSGAVGLDRCPSPGSLQLASLHWLGHLPSLASPVASLLYKEKISGMKFRMTRDEITDQALW